MCVYVHIYIYISVKGKRHHDPCSHQLKAWITLLCYNLLFFSSKFLLFFYWGFSAFFIVPWYLQKFLITAGFKEKKKKKLFKDKTLFLWNLVIYPSWRVWCKFVHFRLIQIVVMFLSASPLTVTPLACRGDQNSCWDPMEASRLPRPSVGESHHECFGSVTSHLSMTNFKLELFSYELAVNQQLKNHESEISDILFHVALLLIRYLCQVGWYIWI